MIDTIFFPIIKYIFGTAGYFLNIATGIAKVLIGIELFILAFKWAFGKGDIVEDWLKIIGKVVLVMVFLNLYQPITKQILARAISYGMSPGISKINDGTTKLVSKSKSIFSSFQKQDLINPTYLRDNDGGIYDSIGNKLTNVSLKVFDSSGTYLRPDAVMGMALITIAPVWEFTSAMKGWSWDKILKCILAAVISLVVVCSVIIVIIQYILSVLEYVFIASIGGIFIPFGLMQQTKFITEKLAGAVWGFAVKNLLMSFVLVIFLSYFYKLGVTEWKGSLDQIVAYIFPSLFFLIMSFKVPELALSLLTGTPQIGMQQAGQALQQGAAAVGGALAGAFAATKLGARAATTAAGGGMEAVGSMAAARQNGEGFGGVAKAGLGSIGRSLGNTMKSGAWAASNRLINGSSSGRGGGQGRSELGEHGGRVKDLTAKNQNTPQGDIKPSGINESQDNATSEAAINEKQNDAAQTNIESAKIQKDNPAVMEKGNNAENPNVPSDEGGRESLIDRIGLGGPPRKNPVQGTLNPYSQKSAFNPYSMSNNPMGYLLGRFRQGYERNRNIENSNPGTKPQNIKGTQNSQRKEGINTPENNSESVNYTKDKAANNEEEIG